MIKIDLNKLLESLFIEDYKLNKQYSYISQIGILTIKSLIPSVNDLGVRVNYTRFTEELNLWSSYRIGENNTLLNIRKNNPGIYWKERDNSILSRVIPIFISNKEYKIVEEEVIKNILFTTGNIKDLFEYISITYLLYLALKNKADPIEKLKEKIIGFSQREFIEKYEDYYKIPILDCPISYKVEFEKEKISLISFLNNLNGEKYPYLNDCINVLNNKEAVTFVGKVLYGFIYDKKSQENLPEFYLSMGTYLMNLRKSRIDPKDLEIDKYVLPDIFKFEEGEIFFHSLIRQSKVIKKEVRNNVLTSLVQTRTGMYLFKKIDL